MNLMFYNFNDFNNLNAAPNGRRPTAGGNVEGRRPIAVANGGPQTQGGMRTQNNFYKSKNLMENDQKGTIMEMQHEHKLNPVNNVANQAGNIHE